MDHGEQPTSEGPGDQGGPSPRPPPWRWPVAIAAIALVLSAIVMLVADRHSSPRAAVTPADVDSIAKAAVDQGLEQARSEPPDSAKVYDAILPSLVSIRPERAGGAGQDAGLGTGVVVNSGGAILTARHVVTGAGVIHVTFTDGTESVAKVVSEDPGSDIAVLVADRPPQVIVPAVLGGGAHVGDAAFAVGHPFGLLNSLTAGVVSGLDRSMPLADGSTLKGLIQFDAAVNPGSSGGPLLNRDGQVIGIVTALANPSQQGYFIGIGFAVPIGTATGGPNGPAL